MFFIFPFCFLLFIHLSSTYLIVLETWHPLEMVPSEVHTKQNEGTVVLVVQFRFRITVRIAQYCPHNRSFEYLDGSLDTALQNNMWVLVFIANMRIELVLLDTFLLWIILENIAMQQCSTFLRTTIRLSHMMFQQSRATCSSKMVCNNVCYFPSLLGCMSHQKLLEASSNTVPLWFVFDFDLACPPAVRLGAAICETICCSGKIMKLKETRNIKLIPIPTPTNTQVIRLVQQQICNDLPFLFD